MTQHFTSPTVARLLAQWTMAGPVKAVHDPAAGLGALLEAVHHTDPDAHLSGHEIDGSILEWWPANTRETLQIANRDYLTDFRERPPASVICNPPYARFQNFPNRREAITAINREYEAGLSQMTNMAAAFLVKAICELQPPTRLAFLMPLEFLDAEYGEPVKRLLLANQHLTDVISISCETDAFPEVITTVGIILYDSAATAPAVRFHRMQNLDTPAMPESDDAISTVPYRNLCASEKWNIHAKPPGGAISQEPATMGDYGKFMRGIATGANRYFHLTTQDADARGLTDRDLVPCVGNTRDLTQPVLDHQEFSRINRRKRAWLFAPQRPLSKAATAYIHVGEETGVPKRHITAHRTPWWKPEHRPPPGILVSTFWRQSPKIILNHSTATHLTAFHGFQILPIYRRLADQLFAYLNTPEAREAIQQACRTYGGGLHKLEPTDLNRLPAPSVARLSETTEAETNEAIQHLMTTARG